MFKSYLVFELSQWTGMWSIWGSLTDNADAQQETVRQFYVACGDILEIASRHQVQEVGCK